MCIGISESNGLLACLLDLLPLLGGECGHMGTPCIATGLTAVKPVVSGRQTGNPTRTQQVSCIPNYEVHRWNDGKRKASGFSA